MKSAFNHTVVKLTALVRLSAEAFLKLLIGSYYVVAPAMSSVKNSAHFLIEPLSLL